MLGDGVKKNRKPENDETGSHVTGGKEDRNQLMPLTTAPRFSSRICELVKDSASWKGASPPRGTWEKRWSQTSAVIILVCERAWLAHVKCGDWEKNFGESCWCNELPLWGGIGIRRGFARHLKPKETGLQWDHCECDMTPAAWGMQWTVVFSGKLKERENCWSAPLMVANLREDS